MFQTFCRNVSSLLCLVISFVGRLGGTQFPYFFFYWLTLSVKYVREKGIFIREIHLPDLADTLML